MATTFVGVELGGERSRARHAAVVLQRKKSVIEVRHWACLMTTDEELLENLAAWAGASGVIAVHGHHDYNTNHADADHSDPHASAGEAGGNLLKRVWRVLDYRLLFALAPRHRTRALVRVEPEEVRRAFAGALAPAAGATGATPAGVLEGLRGLTPSVDFYPLVQHLDRLKASADNSPAGGSARPQVQAAARGQVEAATRAGLSAYAALWCWWHGPAGYDVLGANTESYRLAPRMMDVPDIDAAPF